jgi:hypothetical protein
MTDQRKDWMDIADKTDKELVWVNNWE